VHYFANNQQHIMRNDLVMLILPTCEYLNEGEGHEFHLTIQIRVLML